MTSFGKIGNQRNQLLPTERLFFNYGNDNTISGYNSFFGGEAAGGGIVTENKLVLTNDNSSLVFSAGFNSGFDTLYDWNCVFNTAGTYAYVAESRNASAADASNLVGPAEPQFSRLPIQINSASSDANIYVIESKNYLKLKRRGRTFVEIQGIFRHTGTTDNTFEESITVKRSGNSELITQSSWNIDSFGASSLNPSGITLDFKKIQTLVFEFYDKEMGDVRFGFLVGNTIYYAHFVETNNNSDFLPSSNQFFVAGNLNLPIRDEVEVSSGFVIRRAGIFNDTNGIYFSSSMDATNEPNLIVSQYLQSVSAYNIGGGDKDYLIPFVAGTKEILKIVDAANIPLFSVKADTLLSGNTNRTVFNFDKINIHASGANLNEGCYIDVIYNGSLTGDTFANQPNTESGLLYDTEATAISGGIVIYSGEVYADQVEKIEKSDLQKEYVNAFSRKSITLASGATPTTATKDDILTIVATPLTDTSSILVGASMKGGEIS